MELGFRTCSKQLTTQTVGGEDTYDVIASPSGSSDGSSEFVKVEHSDVQQSIGLVGDTLSFRMLQMHNVGADEKKTRDRRYPVENLMDHGFESEEPYSGILPRTEEFAESVVEKMSDIAKTGVGKVVDASNKAVSDAKVVGEALDDTVHLFGDKLKEMAGQSKDMGHQTLETANDTASKMLSSTAQKAGNVGADVAHLVDEGAKAMHTFEGEFDDLTREISDTTHHAADILTNTLQKAEIAGDPLKEHDAGRHTMLHEPAHGAYQGGYPSEQWGLDWRQYASEAADINASHPDLEVEASVKAVQSADDSSAEESMFDRKGPLTIPHQASEDIIQLDRGFDSPKQSGFEVSPRPPTPPKELDDEDVKPTTIDLGQTTGRSLASGEHLSSILKNSAQGVRFDFKDLDARFLDIVYWRDPKKSGAVLGITLLTLLVFANFPLIAVLSYVGLSVLGGTLGFRIYKLIEAQIKKTDGANPYRAYLENREFHLPKEKVHQQVDALIEHVQFISNKLRRLFLVESIVDSVKFGLLLWALTYVSCWFSGLSLLILAILALFTIPKVYEVYQEPIDRNVFKTKQRIDDINKMIGEKVPFLKKSTTNACEISHEKSY
ncbi:hypothetical protein, variant [Loa loa]|uniref:Reticulon-like protein n=1 Tax=Loa loa TaxID=7209 RepID=A0A1S0ULT2_LOALO|nr:hypothetical protein, variant [Loa loa]EJD76670.1 hypothetical protein, variant [Loa loa]